MVGKQISEDEIRESLMRFSKETIVDLYLSAKAKADNYDKLRELIIEMVKEDE